MKKFLAFTVVLLLMTLTGLAAFAAETTFEGEFRIQSWSEWNFDKKFNDIYDAQYDGWFEQRFRLTVTHTRSEFLKAVVQIDLVEDTWGQGRAMYINNAGPSGGYAPGEYINWAYLDFTVPEIGNFRVGKFPVTWGHGLILSSEHPGIDGIEWSREWGKIATTVLYWKYADFVIFFGPASPDYNHDVDLYALHIAYTPTDNHLIELYGGYVHYHYYDVGFVGLAYTGNIADMIDLKFEGGYLWGKESTGEDMEGYSIYADVSYYNDLYRIGLAFLMVSGDYTSDKDNLPHVWNEAFSWANIVGNDGGGINSGYNNNIWWAGDYLENITSLKLYFEICPMDKLSINAAVLYTWCTEEVGPTAYGFDHPAQWYSNHGGGITGWDDSSDFGWEVDLGFSYEIMEGLTYTFAGAVLFTGDAWDYDANGPAVAGGHEDWGTIWSISNTLLYEF